MNHLHTILYLKRNGYIQVSLDSPGNVYLMKDAEYKKYLAGGEFECIGGKVRAGKKIINAPSQGNWHLVIDNNNSRESLNVALNITNGRQISENEIFKNEENEQPAFQKQQNSSLKDKERTKSDEAHQKHLIKEITKSLKDIDINGLRFLINQAKILVRNLEIEKLNVEINQYNEDIVDSEKTDHLDKQKSEVKEVDHTSTSMDPDETQKNRKKKKSFIDIEQQSDNTFILLLHGVRKTLSRLELREIVKMCHAHISDAEFSEQLYEWLKIRRNDILFDARIRTKDHPVWPEFRRFLRNRFKAKK